MKSIVPRAAGIVSAVAALLLLSTSPGTAGSTSISDGDGVDYDAACVLDASITPPASGNSVPSPGVSSCTVSSYDGSVEGLDLNDGAAVTLESNGAGQLVASWHIDGTVPAAGNGNRAAYDMADANSSGGTYFVLFQNKTLQTNAKYVACPQIPPRPTPVTHRWGSWRDGYHFFVSFSVNWDGIRWIHSVQIGEYAPDASYRFFEFGVDNGSGWAASNIYHPYAAAPGTAGTFSVDLSTPGIIEVAVAGIYQSPDTANCANGHFDYWFARPGDVIANVKGQTTSNQMVTLPATIPLSATCGLTSGLVCESSDVTTVGGFVSPVDITDGNSTAGLANSNTPGLSYTDGAVGVADTLGPGPTCSTPTLGGLLPENPLWTVDTACHLDDDPVSRGSFLAEWWDTAHGFVA